MTTQAQTTVRMIPTEISCPKAVAVDIDGNIYAGCCGGEGSLEKYSPGADLIWKQEAVRVRGISFTQSGNLLATVNSKDRVNVSEYSPEGNLLKIWEMDEIFNPHGIAISNSNNVFIAQTSRWAKDTLQSGNRIMRCSTQGKLVYEWGESGAAPGQLNLPVGIAARFEKVFVTDSYNSRIQVYSPEGDFLYGWGVYGNNEGEFNCPQGIAVDSERNIFVADTYNNRIQIFTEEGKFLSAFGTQGEGDGEFWLPCGVAVTDENIYVADTMNSRISIYRKKEMD